jgi:phosphate:Na+ symporter
MNQIWELLAGVSIFIIGMRLLEEALKRIAGRSFKLFLKKQTSNKFKGILGGAVVTALLQSSSIVNIMVLAFVGAKVLQMENALALMLGSNLGTTFTSWIIAVVGFKLNIEELAWPLTGIAGLIWTILSAQNRFYSWVQFLLGFGFLLLGLHFMQTGVEGSLEKINLDQFNRYPALVFLLLGAIITSIVQASSATIALTLAVLHAGGIDLHAAAAIVLGAEIGTTTKLLILAQGKLPDKKRVALGNFLFNTISSVLAFFTIGPLLKFIQGPLSISDELTALASFQTMVNLLGILLFFPFLKLFGKFLQNRFTQTQEDTSFIHKVSINEPELALQATQEEIRHFMYHLVRYSLNGLDITNWDFKPASWHPNHTHKTAEEQYDYLKDLHGDIQQFYVRLQAGITDLDQTELLDQLIAALRNGMYGAKSMKDALMDADQLRESSNDFKFGYYELSKDRMTKFLKQISPYLTGEEKAASEPLLSIINQVAEQYQAAVTELYGKNRTSMVTDTELATLINYNRELYTAKKSILLAIKDLLLTPAEAAVFKDLPGFIR